MKPRIFDSEVLDVKNASEDVKVLKLSVPENFDFTPGQYVSLSVPFIAQDKKMKKIRRPYSIASLPKKNYIELCVKLVKKGLASEYISKLKKHDKVELFGPLGKFKVSKKSKNKNLIFIANGVGIAPFISMISDLLSSEFNKKIILISGFRNKEKILYKKQLENLKKKYSNFDFFVVLSKQKNSNYKHKGYVQDFLEKFIPENFKGDFYLCGFKKMINSVKKRLHNLEFEKNIIFYEEF